MPTAKRFNVAFPSGRDIVMTLLLQIFILGINRYRLDAIYNFAFISIA